MFILKITQKGGVRKTLRTEMKDPIGLLHFNVCNLPRRGSPNFEVKVSIKKGNCLFQKKETIFKETMHYTEIESKLLGVYKQLNT